MERASRTACLLFATTMLLLVTPAVCFAAETHTASVGTLVAAGLETGGYIQLSIILRDLMGMFSSMAVLIWVAVAIIALTVTAYSGSYQGALWVLIGPPLFYALISSSTVTAGAEWQFGTYLPERKNAAANYIGEPQVQAEVPFLFHKFNVLVSAVIQNIVTVITDSQHRTELLFLARQQMLDGFLRVRMGSPELTNLAKTAFNRCGDIMDDAQLIAQAKGSEVFSQSPSYRSSAAHYKARMTERSILIPPSDSLYAYLKRLHEGLPDCMAYDAQTKMYTSCTTQPPVDPGGIPTDPAQLYRPFFQCLACNAYEGGHCDDSAATDTGASLTKNTKFVDEPMSCADLWCMTGVGVGSFMDTVRTNLEQPQPAFNPSESEAQDLQKQVYQDLRRKLVYDPNVQANPDADKQLANNIWAIQHVIGGYLVKKAIITDSRSQALSNMSEHWELDPTAAPEFRTKMTTQQQRATVRKFNQAQLGESEKFSLYIFAMELPYIQGIILYFLAAAFPFVLLLLLIPGRASGVWTWCAAWAWAKSWDVGYAAVMVIDEVLWELLPHTPFGEPPTTFDPAGVLGTAFQGDPAYSLSTYYVIIGMLLVSIPLLSAQVILRGKAAMAGMLIEGIKGFADRLGNIAALSSTMGQMHDITHALTTIGGNMTSDKFGEPGSFTAPGAKAAWDKVNQIEQDAISWRNQSAALSGQFAMLGVAAAADTGAASALLGRLSPSGQADVNGISSRLNQLIGSDTQGLRHGFNQAQAASLMLVREAERMKMSIAYADMAWKLTAFGNSPEFKQMDATFGGQSGRMRWWGAPPQSMAAMILTQSLPERAQMRAEQLGAEAATSVALGMADSVFETFKSANSATAAEGRRP